ncbi:isopentenyl-diphosphate delta-isomerase [Cryobacterium mesophilum]|uniref:Isopentenyl-diphosphate Delta-isomerase n=1 Tax=Terrimesophilobacter mesophilus TaxID=433647 RepID=A0A4R8VB39_9MICO|nr:isopentenyl-diphosphate Delta-isomerase [Terrimesophilobacter mesophilus]MBB5633052.1 isopentenyl-diphosphate delta-isomerase [Terrimesophilobacter mesophilus]TFB79815.1 isopentenyl-diphosphate Delta-isomerase [Terrimesophilobacter mesophilus]
MTTEPELVVLVDEDGVPTGSVEKFAVHTTDTPLHLAFSCHVYNEAGQVLATRRALGKLTWPGVWTNSFCGHPAPGESMDDALSRRARLELGISISQITPLLPDFRYRAVDASGIVENEICPVFRAVTTDAVAANPGEVAEWAWVDPASLIAAVAAAPYAFSPWIVLQLAELGR